MSEDVYQLWGVWKARKESAEQGAKRLGTMLTAWAAAHNVLSSWNQQGPGAIRKLPFCSMPPRIDELARVFEKSRVYKDVPRVPWPELGYSVAAWNAHNEPRFTAFHLMPGCYKDANRIFPNSLEVHLPKRVAETADIMNATVLRKLLLGAVSGWEPDWASLKSFAYSNRFNDVKPFPLFRSGWMTYLSAPYARRISPPASAIVESTADGGLLLLATDETFTVENPKHVAVADEIQRALQPLQNENEKRREAQND